MAPALGILTTLFLRRLSNQFMKLKSSGLLHRSIYALAAGLPSALLAHPGHEHPVTPPQHAMHWVIEPQHFIGWAGFGCIVWVAVKVWKQWTGPAADTARAAISSPRRKP